MPKRRNSAAPPRPRRAGGGPARWPLLLALGAALALGACFPPQASYDVGLATSRVTGFVNARPADPTLGGPLIVVLKYHHQYVTYGDGSPVLRPSAHVVRPGRAGGFSVDMPSDVVSMEMFFIAPEHLTQVFRFRRQIGVGNIHYRADLQPMQDWRSHYYTFLSPQLEHLIVEPRYNLAPAEQRMLAEWLQVQNARLGAPLPPEGASHPAGGAAPGTPAPQAGDRAG